MFSAILLQTVILLLLSAVGLNSAAWFYGGMVFMFWANGILLTGDER